MQKVWIQLKSSEKPMLVELDEINLNALDTPNTVIHGIRTNSKTGLVSKVGFNSNNIDSYNYSEEKEE